MSTEVKDRDTVNISELSDVSWIKMARAIGAMSLGGAMGDGFMTTRCRVLHSRDPKVDRSKVDLLEIDLNVGGPGVNRQHIVFDRARVMAINPGDGSGTGSIIFGDDGGSRLLVDRIGWMLFKDGVSSCSLSTTDVTRSQVGGSSK